ncbi:baculoviral IAP repeat-containing protein 2-like [Gigantopelta aegis]|uniref:baculoviral IAP repeat-containing protein 2-like n=1 Tax=Gigantopelta aegis TaxID=1735272 RepID=UPI001B887C33|nr:baculoviral IAP repeat-containing protein 2-like [Gigantopelta aegis]XP_041360919.1 baculoviral IAP repeat-containing protein 2-like [Gigantopelta aegis]
MAINGYNPDSEAAKIQLYQQSFIGWPGKVSAVKLAIAGFRYLGPEDKVICDTCGLKLYNWDGSEKPTEVHKSNSPRCEFINKWFGGSVVSDSVRVTPSEPPPAFPQFSDISSRLNSFEGWPQTMTHQSPSTLAAEGFYYIGSADRTCCFQCGIRLRDWDVDDDPFDCHKEYAPGCSFIKRRERGRQGQLEKTEETSKEQAEGPENGISTLTIGGATSDLKTSNNAPNNQATNTVTHSVTNTVTPNVAKTVTSNVTSTMAPNVTNTLTTNVTSAVSEKHTDLFDDATASVNVADGGQSDKHNVDDVSRNDVSDDVVIDWQCPKVLAVLDYGCTKEEITKAFKQYGGDHFRDAQSLCLAIMNTS